MNRATGKEQEARSKMQLSLKALAPAHIKELGSRVRETQATEARAAGLASHCRGDDCPILDGPVSGARTAGAPIAGRRAGIQAKTRCHQDCFEREFPLK